jgi:hypothetical protein
MSTLDMRESQANLEANSIKAQIARWFEKGYMAPGGQPTNPLHSF